MSRIACRVASIFVLSLAGAVANAASPAYSILEITPAPASPGTGYALNDSGVVAGTLSVGTSHVPHAFSWTADSGITELGALIGTRSFAFGINGAGQIAGSSQVDPVNTGQQPILWNGQRIGLSTLGGLFGSAADINNAGVVVGTAQNVLSQYRAFTNSNGTAHSLLTFGGTASGANAINNNGLITGYATTDDDAETHAFVYDTEMHDLGTLGGVYSEGFDINDSGHLVGASTTAPGRPTHAFYFNGAMHDLGTLGGSVSEAFGINNQDEIVGDSATASGAQHAFVYQNGVMSDLNLLVHAVDPSLGAMTLTEARAVNNLGQILVNGSDAVRGQLRSFVLTPLSVVPLPPSAPLLLSGLGCLLIFARFRRAALPAPLTRD